MADFTRKKLQVFVSSTYSDLIDERQAAVEAILTAGHIPAGMELFTAGDESQMEVIKQWIDESDVYLLILGGRYGNIEVKSGKSYTHLEYEYALSKNKPLFACVIKESAIEPRVKAKGIKFVETDNSKLLNEFRAQVLTKMSKFWEDSKDIKITVAETLSHLARRDDLIGWVRSSTQSDLPAIADEITRLSKENAHLRSQVANGDKEERINGLTFAELKLILDEKKLTVFFIANRVELAGNPGLSTRKGPREIQELCTLGLIEPGLYGVNRITQAGCAFLNKLEMLHLQTIANASDDGS
ncbi:MAG: hypothetical protein JWM68_3680 [Verrucomicrobiales bacterium]|nr:hypothetical protein [Verrucomicrobiales bacterium]